jgi:hypothetical protein
MDKIQDEGEGWEVACDTLLQGLTAVGQGDAVLNVCAVTFGHLVGKAVKRGSFAVQGGPELFVLGLIVGRWCQVRRRFLGKEAGDDLRRGPWGRGNGVRGGHDGFLLFGALVAFV